MSDYHRPGLRCCVCDWPLPPLDRPTGSHCEMIACSPQCAVAMQATECLAHLDEEPLKEKRSAVVRWVQAKIDTAISFADLARGLGGKRKEDA